MQKKFRTGHPWQECKMPFYLNFLRDYRSDVLALYNPALNTSPLVSLKQEYEETFRHPTVLSFRFSSCFCGCEYRSRHFALVASFENLESIPSLIPETAYARLFISQPLHLSVLDFSPKLKPLPRRKIHRPST